MVGDQRGYQRISLPGCTPRLLEYRLQEMVPYVVDFLAFLVGAQRINPWTSPMCSERRTLGSFSLPNDGVNKRDGGGGNRVNRPPATPSHYFLRQTTIFGDFLCSLVAVRATKERSVFAQEC
jgi:hypothetical protein